MATRGDLDRAELENILEARTWAASRTWKPDDLLDSHALADLHHRMFAQVWRWAGKWRSRETSIGIAPEHIQTDLRILVDDARAWTEFTTYPADEIAVRFHHRLVFIHPFPNGNGRHARLAADLLVTRGVRSSPGASYPGCSQTGSVTARRCRRWTATGTT